MRNTCCHKSVTLIILLFLCPIVRTADDPFDYTVTIGNEQLHFIAQPELGYAIKSSRNNLKASSLDNTVQKIQREDTEYLNVANRPDMKIVRSKHASDQIQRNIRILKNQSDTEYIAPLYTLDGETVAVIPEIIVRLYHETERSKLEELCIEVDCIIIRNLLYTEQEFLISPAAHNAEDVLTTVEVLDSADFIEWAWPNIAFQPKLCGPSIENEPERLEPDDEYFNDQWHLNAIRAPEAWFYITNNLNRETVGDANIVIAVLDNGVDINHPDLVNNIWTNTGEIPGNGIDDDGNGFEDDVYGWNFVEDNNDVNPADPNNAHGTACAGLIAAQGNNNETGVTGVTWNCTILPILIIPFSGTCSTVTEPVDGLRYAAAQGADVINNSWGFSACEPIHSTIRDITRLNGIGRNGKGCVVIWAVPNESHIDWKDLSACPEVISVGSTDKNDKVLDLSGRGSILDIVAPGWNILTTCPIGKNKYGLNPDYYYNSGTSMACPITAGVAALVLSVNKDLTNREVGRILLRSAHDLEDSCWDPNSGFGRVDAYAAISMASDPPPSANIYVDTNTFNDPNKNGSSENPFDNIQDAINNAIDGDTIEVRLGIYTGEKNRDIDFIGKAILVRSIDPNNPEIVIGTVIDCNGTKDDPHRGFYFHHSEGPDSILDGLTIVNGYGLKAGSVFVGGGIYCSASPTIRNCVISGNIAENWGGGLHCFTGDPTIINCTVAGNIANEKGGGIYNTNSNPMLANCTIIGNLAGDRGGGMYINNSNPTLTNCTFKGNMANNGNGITCDSVNSFWPSTLQVINCILWDDGEGIWNNDGSTINITYSNVSAGWEGKGNIDADPLFADPNNGDYHLKSEMGRWDPNSQSWVQDDVTSPCIDAGDPNTDFSGETWPHGGRINMGAYGGMRQASMSLETDGMSLPNVAFIFSHRDEEAEDFDSLLKDYGCSTTLIRLTEVTATPLDSYDLIVVANDTQYVEALSDPNTVAAIEDSGKPIVGLGDGGYDFFGLLGLWIGNPNGGHGSKNSIEVVDLNSSLFSTPYSIEIPEDRTLQLYIETNHVGLYLWPTIPESVIVLGKEVDSVNYFPLAAEFDRYLLWGFTESPQKMTEVGKRLFINVVIWTANEGWESEN